MKHFFVIIFFAVTALNAFADETSCKTKMLPLGSLGAVRNQGVAGLCFAYAAADLVSWSIGWRVSAMDIALYEFRNSSKPRMQDVYHSGGDTVTAINRGAKEGFCPEVELPSDEDRIDFTMDPHAPIFDAFADLDQLNWTRSTYSSVLKVFPNITPEDFVGVMKFKYPKRRILELQKRNCPGRKSAPDFRMGVNSSGSPSEFLRIIDRELNKNLIVGIAFHSNAIYTIPDKEDGHVVSIVGRRWNKERSECEYRIRDTFSAQCDVYKTEIECDGGYIWVNENLLRENVFEVNYILRR